MRKIIIFYILLFFISLNIFASTTKFINNGAQTLDFDIGARSRALGGAYVAVADDVDTIFYNVAGLANLDNLNLSFSHFSLFQELSIQSFSMAYPVGIGVLGMGVNYFHTGEFNQILNGEILDKTISFSSVVGNIGYGFNLLKNLKIGINGKFILNNIADTSGKAFAGDIGILFNTEFLKYYNKVENNLRIGLSAQNFGTFIKYKENEEKLPQKVRLGLFYKPVNYVLFSLEGNYWLGYKIDEALLFKGGVELFPDYFITPSAGVIIDKDKINFAGGLGIGLHIGTYNYKLNMSYMGNEFLGSSLYFTLTLSPQTITKYRKNISIDRKLIPPFNILPFKFSKESLLKEKITPVRYMQTQLEGKGEVVTEFNNLFVINSKYLLKDENNPEIIISPELKKGKTHYYLKISLIDSIRNDIIERFKIRFKTRKAIKKICKFLNKKIEFLIKEDFFTPFKISSVPSRASVLFNGNLIGNTPVYYFSKKGVYPLKLNLEGFQEIKTNIDLNKNIDYNFILKKYYNIPENFDITFSTKNTNENELTTIEALKFIVIDGLKGINNVTINRKAKSDIILNTTIENGNTLHLSIRDNNLNKIINEKNLPIANNNDYLKISSYIANFISSYIHTINNKYGSIYKKYKDGKVKFYFSNKKYKCLIDEFNEVYKNNETVKVRTGWYHYRIIDNNNVYYKGEIEILPRRISRLIFFDKYRDGFDKLDRNFWGLDSRFKNNVIYNEDGVILQSNKDNHYVIMKSYKIVPVNFKAILKYQSKYYNRFFVVVESKNRSYIFYESKKGYILISQDKKSLKEKLRGVLLTGMNIKDKHTLEIKYYKNKIKFYIDDIKIDELEADLKEYVRFIIYASGRKFYYKLDKFSYNAIF